MVMIGAYIAKNGSRFSYTNPTRICTDKKTAGFIRRFAVSTATSELQGRSGIDRPPHAGNGDAIWRCRHHGSPLTNVCSAQRHGEIGRAHVLTPVTVPS